MKKLQNNFTTPEQSNRLIELGVPKDSANHYYGKDGKIHYIDGTIPYSLLWETGCTPCWSVGRLIEIYRQFVFSVELLGTLILNDDIIEAIISSMETSVNKCGIDFSKLED